VTDLVNEVVLVFVVDRYQSSTLLRTIRPGIVVVLLFHVGLVAMPSKTEPSVWTLDGLTICVTLTTAAALYGFGGTHSIPFVLRSFAVA